MKTLVRCFLIFMIGSFVGCLIEEIWCFIRNKCFQIRRSLVHLPLIPIYGFASLFVIMIANKVGFDMWKVFIIGVIVSTIVEYLSSFIQEKVFSSKSWDYSGYKFNLNGRVNLVYSLGFGFIAVIAAKFINDLVLYIELNTSSSLLYFVITIIMIIFIVDVVISSLACLRQKRRRDGIEATNCIAKYLDIKYNDNRLNKIYNNSIYVG